MAALHQPDNIKVHLAGCEVQNQYEAVRLLGVQYGLYTCYPFVERMVFGKSTAPIMPLPYQKENPYKLIPEHIIKNERHVIQDSGLFTLMFGSKKGKVDGSIINKWYDGLVEFTLANGQGATCVEVDCQKVLGVEQAWEFRERMRKDLPNNRIINVFHLEDGPKGLDRLIEYSDYIAISVPELRFAHKKNMVTPLAHYIKNKKPEIDIHLLGCTELALLHENRFCTSADSTSYLSTKRYGFIKGHHQKNIKTDMVQNMVGIERWNAINQLNNEINTNGLCLTIEYLKQQYQKACGNQDYKYPEL
ncbi:MAG: hypothetical protein KBS70_05215 [Bacteroidales bacterium]|nr:hypothetical protein [Candidatus Colicola equi]